MLHRVSATWVAQRPPRRLPAGPGCPFVQFAFCPARRRAANPGIGSDCHGPWHYHHGSGESQAGKNVSLTGETRLNQAETTRALLLARFPVFAQLPAARLDELLAGAVLRHVPAGTVLFEPNMPCEGFPLVLEGSVRVVKGSSGGREILLYRVSPGEGCILSGGCLLGHNEYAARGIAEDEVTLLGITPAQFQDLILQFPPFRRFVFDMYGARLAEVMELIDEVAFRKLDSRLARLLVQRGPVLNATHQNLADELGSVRVFVSRMLRSFEERGWVSLERERVTVVDPKALMEFSNR